MTDRVLSHYNSNKSLNLDFCFKVSFVRLQHNLPMNPNPHTINL